MDDQRLNDSIHKIKQKMKEKRLRSKKQGSTSFDTSRNKSRRLNTSFRSKTLYENNRQLTNALEHTRREMKATQSANLQLLGERQQLYEHINCLQQFADKKADEMDIEISAFVQVRMQSIKEVLNKISYSMLGTVDKIQEALQMCDQFPDSLHRRSRSRSVFSEDSINSLQENERPTIYMKRQTTKSPDIAQTLTSCASTLSNAAGHLAEVSTVTKPSESESPPPPPPASAATPQSDDVPEEVKQTVKQKKNKKSKKNITKGAKQQKDVKEQESLDIAKQQSTDVTEQQSIEVTKQQSAVARQQHEDVTKQMEQQSIDVAESDDREKGGNTDNEEDTCVMQTGDRDDNCNAEIEDGQDLMDTETVVIPESPVFHAVVEDDINAEMVTHTGAATLDDVNTSDVTSPLLQGATRRQSSRIKHMKHRDSLLRYDGPLDEETPDSRDKVKSKPNRRTITLQKDSTILSPKQNDRRGTFVVNTNNGANSLKSSEGKRRVTFCKQRKTVLIDIEDSPTEALSSFEEDVNEKENENRPRLQRKSHMAARARENTANDVTNKNNVTKKDKISKPNTGSKIPVKKLKKLAAEYDKLMDGKPKKSKDFVFDFQEAIEEPTQMTQIKNVPNVKRKKSKLDREKKKNSTRNDMSIFELSIGNEVTHPKFPQPRQKVKSPISMALTSCTVTNTDNVNTISKPENSKDKETVIELPDKFEEFPMKGEDKIETETKKETQKKKKKKQIKSKIPDTTLASDKGDENDCKLIEKEDECKQDVREKSNASDCRKKKIVEDRTDVVINDEKLQQVDNTTGDSEPMEDDRISSQKAQPDNEVVPAQEVSYVEMLVNKRRRRRHYHVKYPIASDADATKGVCEDVPSENVAITNDVVPSCDTMNVLIDADPTDQCRDDTKESNIVEKPPTVPKSRSKQRKQKHKDLIKKNPVFNSGSDSGATSRDAMNVLLETDHADQCKDGTHESDIVEKLPTFPKSRSKQRKQKQKEVVKKNSETVFNSESESGVTSYDAMAVLIDTDPADQCRDNIQESNIVEKPPTVPKSRSKQRKQKQKEVVKKNSETVFNSESDSVTSCAAKDVLIDTETTCAVNNQQSDRKPPIVPKSRSKQRKQKHKEHIKKSNNDEKLLQLNEEAPTKRLSVILSPLKQQSKEETTVSDNSNDIDNVPSHGSTTLTTTESAQDFKKSQKRKTPDDVQGDMESSTPPKRSRRAAAKNICFKEPALSGKLRRGDDYSLGWGKKGNKTEESKENRKALDNVTNTAS